MELLSETTTIPKLRSPECLARGLPQGGKPANESVLRRTVRRSRGRKSERISESELRGIVKCNLVALLIRGSLWARGWWDLLTGSSTVIDNPAGHRRKEFRAQPRTFAKQQVIGTAPLRCPGGLVLRN